jgi:ABC-type lipoprotein export system ATPase subunit
MDPLLTLRNVNKFFYRGEEKIHAIRNLSLEILRGEFIAVTGASGSGKSTLLYMMGLLDSPNSGSFLIDGTLTETLSDDERAKLRNRSMGFIFQSFHLLPRATALRNVMMPLVYTSSYGEPISERDQRERAEAALKMVGLTDRMYHLPNQLSGGQRQRVAIARAIVNRPQILFADEPTGNLDSKVGQEILSIFEDLNGRAVTIVMVTHDPAIANRAKRRLVIEDGAVKEG